MKIQGNTRLLEAKSTAEIKLKDKQGRNRVVVNLQKYFGFIPEIIIIDKILGKTNAIKIHAILTDEEIRKEREGVAESEKAAPERPKKDR